MKESVFVSSESQLPQVAQRMLDKYPNHRVFAFYGTMGAGKTTFIKAVCLSLGILDVTSSPTFSIVNEYVRDTGDPVFHFDFYRIKDEREAFDLGYEEYFYSGNYCFIEWPEKIEGLLPSETIKVEVFEKNEGRMIVF
ncbi:MAG: tRNA (adenosine(37)-N6)-threonylcarbamoyltransferase complex ATPase subunit type 1 TsaE [Bacteroidales bacterium]|nr:tRNA (adenosine(37)-N6)-threonylcarbamoyltransferase complex ATPase subunit type 1 TsaE [Bacteroidales bacterium]